MNTASGPQPVTGLPGNMPDPVARGISLWRMAALLYLPAFALSIAQPLLTWDTMVADAVAAAGAATRQAGPNVPAPSPADIESTVLSSTIFFIVLQAVVWGLTWLLIHRLPAVSPAARMILSVLAVFFIVNAIVNVPALLDGTPWDAAEILLTLAASGIAGVASAFLFRDTTPRGGHWFASAAD